jgi:DNA-binding MarR family transcriptional regulator
MARDIRRVFDDLVRFETVLWAAVDERLQKECAVSLGTFNVMLIVDETPNCRVFDIARSLAITVGGTSQAIDRMEKAGRCVRRANPADRRSSIIELTPEGAALLASAAPVFDEELERLLRVPLASRAFTHLGEALATLRSAALSNGEPS